LYIEVKDDFGNSCLGNSNSTISDDKFNYSSSWISSECIKGRATKLIITLKAKLVLYGEANYINKETVKNTTNEKYTGLAESYEFIEKKEVILGDILIDIKK